MATQTRSQDEELTYFLTLALECASETIENLKDAMRFLSEIDVLFLEFIKEAGGIKAPVAAVLIMNAHASLRAAIGLALSGQLIPTFMALRGGIESALYANAMVAEPSLQDVWLRRDVDEASREACRNQFTTGRMFRLLGHAHNPEYAEGIRELYDASIDFGAHPNSRSMISSLRIEEGESGDHTVEFAYLHGGGSFDTRRAILACAECALQVLLIALITFPDHVRREDLNHRALDLQKRIPLLVRILGFEMPG